MSKFHKSLALFSVGSILIYYTKLPFGYFILLSFTLIFILFLGVVIIQWNFFFNSKNHGDKKNKNISLSFDDGPNSGTEMILEILKKHQLKAVFFCIGKKIAENPELLKKIDAGGHLIGNHSYSHEPKIGWSSTAKLILEMDKTNQIIFNTIGKKPLLYRPPFGICNPNIAQSLKKTKMISIGWRLRSFDTQINSEANLLKRLNKNIQAGDIILLHDHQTTTAQILEKFIVSTQNKGFTFVPLNQLISIIPYE